MHAVAALEAEGITPEMIERQQAKVRLIDQLLRAPDEDSLRKLAKEKNLATQMGNQGSAESGLRRAVEVIQGGVIGKPKELHVWSNRPIWPQGIKEKLAEQPVPDTMAWDFWLGPAPWRPYHSTYLPGNWRRWWDFGTGALGDIGCHAIDPVFRALKLGYPTSVESCCTLVNHETYPVASRVTYEFPARGDLAPVTLHWYDGGKRPSADLIGGREVANTARPDGDCIHSRFEAQAHRAVSHLALTHHQHVRHLE